MPVQHAAWTDLWCYAPPGRRTLRKSAFSCHWEMSEGDMLVVGDAGAAMLMPCSCKLVLHHHLLLQVCHMIE